METLSPSIGFAEFLEKPYHVRGFEHILPPSGGGRFCPLSVLTRDMSAGVFSAGGALITSGVSDQVTAPLRANSVVLKLGAQLKLGLIPPTSFPVLGTDFQANFVSEYATAPESDLSVSTANMTPHRVVATTTISQLLNVQSKPDSRALVGQQATAAISTAIDKTILVGVGGSQPLGIFNTPGVQKTTFGGNATLANLLAFETALGLANAEGPNASIGWVQSPSTRAALKGRPKFSAGSDTLENDRGYIVGYPAETTTNLSATNQLLLANWNSVIVAWFFSGVFILQDKFTLSKTGEEIITITAFIDGGILHPTAAVISTDPAQ
jgi:HK97 family phage major capsid protein